MKFLSALCLLLVIDGVWGLIDGHNLWTLHHSPHATLVNILSVVGALIVGPWLWRTAAAYEYAQAIRSYRESGDDTALREWDRDFN